MNVLRLQKYDIFPPTASAHVLLPLPSRVLANKFSLRLTRKYPQFDQGEIFALQEAFSRLDVDDKGYLDEITVIKAIEQSERKPYDAVRSALRQVELDSSRRVEFEDYVDVRNSRNGLLK